MKRSTPGTLSTIPPPAGTRRRTLGLGLIVAGLAALILWMEISTWSQVIRLERAFGDIQPAEMFIGVRLREGVERLGAALLRYRLSGDAGERETFHRLARDLAEQVNRSDLRTTLERELAGDAGRALEVFLRQTDPLLDEAVRGVRRDTAAEVHREILEMAAPALAVAEELVVVQTEGVGEFFNDAEQSLAALRTWLGVSLGLIALLTVGVAWLGHEVLVRPLRVLLSRTEADAGRQERLASLGTLAAGVAHEIRNPLAAMKLRLFSLKKSLPGDLARNEDLWILHGELQRLERIVGDFLQFARPPEPRLRRVELGTLLEAVRVLLGSELSRQGIALDVQMGEATAARGDAEQLRQVIINLVQNAAEATGREGRITLSTRHGAARLSRRTEPVVIVDVSDTGPGISPETEARMFDPFFSTKEGGTGLGLPMAARIVENHGGSLQYSTRRGTASGTVFSVVLPRPPTHESQVVAD